MLWRWQSFLELCSGSGFEDLGADPVDVKMEGALHHSDGGVYTVVAYCSDAYRERKPMPAPLHSEADGSCGVCGALLENGAMPVGGQHTLAECEEVGAGCGVLCPDLASPTDRRPPRSVVGQRGQTAINTGRTPAITPSDIEGSMGLVRANVKAWNPSNSGLVKVRALQDAPRNHGQVDMMRCDGGRGHAVAVKKMPNWWITSGPEEFGEKNEGNPEHPWHDLGILRLLNSECFPFACQLVGVHRDEEHTYVLTSLATEGDLFSWCSCQPSPGREREMSFAPVAKQIFSAVGFLHELGIAHRDLSLENILLNDVGDGELEVKLIDFAQATSARKCRGAVRGKLRYQAPEMHTRAEYDSFLVDSFALGVVLFSMATEDYPWATTKRNRCKLFEYIRAFGLGKFLENRMLRRGGGKHLAEVFSPELTEVVQGFLELGPDRRLCLGESCFTQGPAEELRDSVWDLRWLAEGL